MFSSFGKWVGRTLKGAARSDKAALLNRAKEVGSFKMGLRRGHVTMSRANRLDRYAGLLAKQRNKTLGLRGDITKAVGYYTGAAGLDYAAQEAQEGGDSGLALLAGAGSFWLKTRGFRQALRAPLTYGARKMPFSGMDKVLRSYDRIRNVPERLVGRMAKGAMKFGSGAVRPFAIGSEITRDTKRLFGVPLKMPGIAKPLVGAGEIGYAFGRGTIDRASSLFRGGAPLKYGQGIMGRMMKTKYPFWGAAGFGFAAGGAHYAMKVGAMGGDARGRDWAPEPNRGINPRNYGGGITIRGSRGQVRYSMGSRAMSERMMRM